MSLHRPTPAADLTMDQAWQSWSAGAATVPGARRALHAGTGLLATAVIFGVLAAVRHEPELAPAAPPESLRRAAPPPQPPPAPPRSENPRAAEQPGAVVFPSPIRSAIPLAPETSDSVIRVRAVAPQRTEEVRPDLAPQFDFAPGAFQPGTAARENDPDRVFHSSEVDQPPVAQSQKLPRIGRQLFDETPRPRANLLYIVNARGFVEKVWVLRTSGNAEFDARLTAAVAEWVFRPALKGGRSVRCMIQQDLVVRFSSGSPFEAN